MYRTLRATLLFRSTFRANQWDKEAAAQIANLRLIVRAPDEKEILVKRAINRGIYQRHQYLSHPFSR